MLKNRSSASALLGAFVAILSGCGGPQTLGPPQPAADNAVAAKHSGRVASWMAPQAQSKDLLYVSDESGTVFTVSYPGGKLLGMITGLQAPAGLCSDSAGDVFIADTPAQSIFEYKHGKTKPTTVIGVVGYPEGCSVDPTTGNLAVTNYENARPLGPGSVSVVNLAKNRKTTTYTDPSINVFFFCGYDGKGNLYVDGVNSGSTRSEFAELPKGGASLRDFTLDRKINYPGAIQWDGADVAIEDVFKDVVYQVKVAGSIGKVLGTLRFGGDDSALLTQFWIEDQTIILPYGKMRRAVHRVGFWPYPSGGVPTKVLDLRGSSELFGATVSLASPRRR